MNTVTRREEREALWREWVRAQAASGQTIRAFCATQAVSERSFSYWKGRFSSEAKAVVTVAGEKSLSRFAEIFSRMPNRSPLCGPRIHLLNGVVIELGDPLNSEGTQSLIQKLCGVSDAKS